MNRTLRTTPMTDAGSSTPVAVPPLTAWRRMEPNDFGPETVANVRDAVAASPLLHHRQWPHVLRGDPAASVAVAIDVLRTQGLGTFGGDLAMSGLVLHAAAGDAAAALVVAHGLSILAHGHARSGELLDRAGRWARRWPRARR